MKYIDYTLKIGRAQVYTQQLYIGHAVLGYTINV
jgi:hypothetical protein